MAPRKETTNQLSPEETSQVQSLFSHYSELARRLRSTTDRSQAETVLHEVFDASEPTQLTFLKSLSRTKEQDAADVLAAINALSPQKEIRKEARRALIQLESAKIYPQWTPANTQASAVQLTQPNPPRFWKGFASQTREEGEMQLILCWEQGYNYDEVRMFSFLLDFWNDGIKDTFTEVGTKRKVNERINELSSGTVQLSLTPCTLAEGKRLLTEALDINAWHKTSPHESYKTHIPLINKLVLQVEDPGQDSGQTFIAPDMEIQEVTVNFIGAWSFGDFGLAYDLLTAQSPVRNQLSRDEWIEQHRTWFNEAHPTRMELGFVHEREQSQSALWLPTSAQSALGGNKKELEVGWSLELTDTQLNGTIAEMPMGTAINKETGRHWFWNSYTLVKEQDVWRIQGIKDEGAALQGLSVTELQKRIKEYEETMDKIIQQRDQKLETFMEEMSWRLAQLLHFYDALLAQLPLDYTLCEEAYSRSVLTGNPERMIVYLERTQQRFPQNKADTLRRLGSTLTELAFRYDSPEFKARREHLLTRAEEALREAITVDNTAMSHTLLGELLMSLDRNEDAQTELLTAQTLIPTGNTDKNIEASIYAGLGNVAMRLEHINEAIPYYLKVAELNPQYPGVWFSLGFAQRLLKDFEQAEKYYLQALQTEPGDPRVYSELTALYMNSSDKNKARELLERGITINPDSAYLHALLASVFAELGDRRRAQRQLEEAERIDPEFDLIPAVRQQLVGGRKRV
jgi:Tetratricopeptide repeat